MIGVFTRALDIVYRSDRYAELLAWLASDPEPVLYHEIHFAVPAFKKADQRNVTCFGDGLKSYIVNFLET